MSYLGRIAKTRVEYEKINLAVHLFFKAHNGQRMPLGIWSAISAINGLRFITWVLKIDWRESGEVDSRFYIHHTSLKVLFDALE